VKKGLPPLLLLQSNSPREYLEKKEAEKV